MGSVEVPCKNNAIPSLFLQYLELQASPFNACWCKLQRAINATTLLMYFGNDIWLIQTGFAVLVFFCVCVYETNVVVYISTFKMQNEPKSHLIALNHKSSYTLSLEEIMMHIQLHVIELLMKLALNYSFSCNNNNFFLELQESPVNACWPPRYLVINATTLSRCFGNDIWLINMLICSFKILSCGAVCQLSNSCGIVLFFRNRPTFSFLSKSRR